jgi:SH3 domain-containing YSC84-like protein 1
MNKIAKQAIPLLAMFFLCMIGVSRADQDKTDATERLNSAATTLRDVAQAPDKGIPDEVFKGAKCIAVVPRMIKGGFIVGAKHGRGVSTCRLPSGRWSAPAFFVVTGGTWGAQIGVEDVELVMMIMNDEGMRHLLQNKFQVGGSASASAGPVGRHASAAVDWKVETQMLTYSRAKGLFAGVDLDGSVVERDNDTMDALYGKEVTTSAALTGKVPAPAAARPFLTEVARVKTEAKNENRDRN